MEKLAVVKASHTLTTFTFNLPAIIFFFFSFSFLFIPEPLPAVPSSFYTSNIRSYQFYFLDLLYPQVFRALANLLEVINYSITFYIYCLFSEDFRNTLIRTVQWPWSGLKLGPGGDDRRTPMKRSPIPRPTTTTTPPTTAVATPGHAAPRASV